MLLLALGIQQIFGGNFLYENGFALDTSLHAVDTTSSLVILLNPIMLHPHRQGVVTAVPGVVSGKETVGIGSPDTQMRGKAIVNTMVEIGVVQSTVKNTVKTFG